MKAVIQRVSRASVNVDGAEIAGIGRGFLILLGVVKGDDETHSSALAKKCADLRIFEDENGKMNLSIKEIGGEILVVSQFTLGADCRRGRRPSFDNAADPKTAAHLYDFFCNELSSLGVPVKTGKFAAHMDIHLTNDGPVTIILDTQELI